MPGFLERRIGLAALAHLAGVSYLDGWAGPPIRASSVKNAKSVQIPDPSLFKPAILGSVKPIHCVPVYVGRGTAVKQIDVFPVPVNIGCLSTPVLSYNVMYPFSLYLFSGSIPSRYHISIKGMGILYYFTVSGSILVLQGMKKFINFPASTDGK